MSESNLVLRGNGYSARLAVPTDLRIPGRPTQLWKVLGTHDPRLAKRLKNEQIAVWQTGFEDQRRRRAPVSDDYQAAAYRHYEEERELDELARSVMPKASEFDRIKAEITEELRTGKTDASDLNRLADLLEVADPLKRDQISRAVRRRRLVEHYASGETALVHWAADAVIRREGLDIAIGSPEYTKLCRHLQRAEIEGLKRAAEIDDGEYEGTLIDPMVRPPAPSLTIVKAKPGERVMELFDIYQREQQGRVKPYTWKQDRLSTSLFMDFLGETAHVSLVTRKAISQWKQKLASWPVKASDAKEFKGLSFAQVIAKNEHVGKPVITGKTINRYLSGLGGFAKGCETRDTSITIRWKGSSWPWIRRSKRGFHTREISWR